MLQMPNSRKKMSAFSQMTALSNIKSTDIKSTGWPFTTNNNKLSNKKFQTNVIKYHTENWTFLENSTVI